MKQFIYFLLLTFIITSNCGHNSFEKGDYLSGRVVAIIDGDTFDLLTKRKKTIRIRMEGIDAPEKGMPFYRASKNHLGKLCYKKDIKLLITGKDSRDRLLGYTYLKDGTELSQEMIKAGYAWHFKKYNSDPLLSRLEVEARKAKLGLWINENPMEPGINRKLHFMGISTKDSFNIRQGEE